MITSIDQAKEFCALYGVKLSDHKTVIVTGNNSIYLSDNIDPSDTSEKFFLKGGTISIEAEKKEKSKAPKEAEESEEKEIEEKQDKKSKK
jgi:hypothetical protein